MASCFLVSMREFERDGAKAIEKKYNQILKLFKCPHEIINEFRLEKNPHLVAKREL